MTIIGSRRDFLRLSAAAALTLNGVAPRSSASSHEQPSSPPDDQKLAFAHYMTGQGTRGRVQSVLEWTDDIRDALAYGIDGWQFNFGRFRGPFARNIEAFVMVLESMGAEGRDFKFFPSFDCNKGRVPAPEELWEWFSLYYDHPNHFRLNGLPVLTAWQARGVGNRFFLEVKDMLRQSGKPIAFIPWLATSSNRVQMEKLFNTWSSIDGFAPWVPGKRAEEAVRYNETAADLCREQGKTLLAGQGFGLLAINKNPKYVNKHAAEAITQQMMPLIDGGLTDCRYLIVATWNDFGEDHHVSPHPPWGPIMGIHPVWSHVGYSVVLKYYLDWWKNGSKPALEDDTVVIFHHTQMVKEGAPPFPYDSYEPDKATDTVYMTALLKAPGTLSMVSGRNPAVQFQAAAGVSHWRVPATHGQQTYALSRNNTTVLQKTSARRIESPPEGVWSWGRYSEFVRS